MMAFIFNGNKEGTYLKNLVTFYATSNQVKINSGYVSIGKIIPDILLF
jgi:hypothetical protein